MGWAVNKARTFAWTIFYYVFSPLIFDAIGKGCRFEGWIDLPQRGGRLKLGNNVHLCRNICLIVNRSASLSLGSGTFLGPSVMVSAQGRVEIGSDVLVGEFVSIHDNDHRTNDYTVPISRQGFEVGSCVIGNGCWIGAGATILRNSSLGDNSILGAGAVLTRSIPEGVVAVGVPARVVRSRAVA